MEPTGKFVFYWGIRNGSCQLEAERMASLRSRKGEGGNLAIIRKIRLGDQARLPRASRYAMGREARVANRWIDPTSLISHFGSLIYKTRDRASYDIDDRPRSRPSQVRLGCISFHSAIQGVIVDAPLATLRRAAPRGRDLSSSAEPKIH